jgi:hypothetical protein
MRWGLGCAVVLATSIPLSAAPAPPPRDKKAAEQKAAREEVRKLFEAMSRGTYREGVTPPALDWQHVPALLERADSPRTLARFPTNPISSFRQPGCTEGTMALWLVECVRHGGRFPSLNPFLTDAGALDGPSLVSQRRAADAFRAWWKKAAALPREEAARLSPLQDTGLSWYGGAPLVGR